MSRVAVLLLIASLPSTSGSIEATLDSHVTTAEVNEHEEVFKPIPGENEDESVDDKYSLSIDPAANPHGHAASGSAPESEPQMRHKAGGGALLEGAPTSASSDDTQATGSDTTLSEISKWGTTAGAHGAHATPADTSATKSTPAKDPAAKLAESAFTYATNAVFILVFAWIYKSKVVDIIPVLQPSEAGSRGKDFRAGLCACWGDSDLCLHVLCCFVCRTAHTWTVSGVMNFFTAVLLQLIFPPCMCLLGGCWLRPKLRAATGIEADGCNDFFAWICCSLCAVGQEAMEVDEMSGFKVTCCCTPLQVGDQSQRQPMVTAPEQMVPGYDANMRPLQPAQGIVVQGTPVAVPAQPAPETTPAAQDPVQSS